MIDILNIKIYRDKLILKVLEERLDKAKFNYLNSKEEIHRSGEAIDMINRLTSLVNDLKRHI